MADGSTTRGRSGGARELIASTIAKYEKKINAANDASQRSQLYKEMQRKNAGLKHRYSLEVLSKSRTEGKRMRTFMELANKIDPRISGQADPRVVRVVNSYMSNMRKAARNGPRGKYGNDTYFSRDVYARK